MASTTYLDLTNRLLQDFGEPVLTSGTFADSRSVHRVAKNAINYAISDIQTKEYTWPFMVMTGSQTLSIGTTSYSWPSDMKHVDMRSFYIEKNTTFGNSTQQLKPIAEEEYRNRYRQRDLDADASVGLGLPKYVFRENNSYGVTRLPDQAYSLKFTYWKTFSSLSAHGDTSDIPDKWDHVIIANAVPYMYKFYNDTQNYSVSKVHAADTLRDMRQLLIPKEMKFWVGQLQDGYYVQ